MISTVLLSLALACGGVEPLNPGAASAIVSATLAIDSTTILMGHTAHGALVLRDAAGQVVPGRGVTWTSRNTSLATVNAQGDIRGVAAGSTVIDAVSEGKTASAPITVTPVPVGPAVPAVPVATVASVTVTIDSASLAPGHTARATAVVKDAAGATLGGRTVTWSSLDQGVATVSGQGVLTALAAGTATIQAMSEGKVGSSPLRVAAVVAAPAPGAGTADLASHDFENGTLGPYTNPWGTDIDVVADPTGSGHGKVARIHYAGTHQDRNRAVSLELPAGRGLGTSTFFKGDFHLPADINPSGLFAQRKLLYWQRDLTTNFPEFSSIVTMFGVGLRVNNVYVPKVGPVVEQQSPVLIQLTPGRWYTLETQLTLNSSPAAKDGIFRLWLDGVLLYEKTDLTWSDPNWPNPQADQRFRYFDVGDQVNSAETYDEYRYWDNIKFGTRRITP